ncbi:MAG TPA: efflux RND transporter periplasmic adaptor subunit [Vicinamibacteria bacterium]|nr:efflux RND transporter periplasmic adaptor subunit [Vicinamibacteria bacterium]
MPTRVKTLSIGASLLLAVAGVACRRSDERASASVPARQTKYRCTMHPTYVSDVPGTCPICGMKLVPFEAQGGRPGTKATPPEGRRIAYYRSPMDPSVHSEKPVRDSMGMAFIPVYEDELPGETSSVAGRAVVALPAEKRQLLGVRSEEVRPVRIDRTIRTVGRVVADERRVHHIHTKFEGYVEHLYVDFTGKLVKKGEPLLSIYSPDLVATQEEYLLALRAQKQLAASDIGSVSQGGADLLQAARERFRLWDIRAEDIAELERTGKARRTLDLYTEAGGYVMQKNVVHGMRVMPSDTLFDIADLSHLWVLADVYESDLPAIRIGMAAEMTVPYLPDRTWRGPVTYVAPTVEEKTRTVKVRIEVDNQADSLKPDMFADVFLKVDLGTGLTVPDDAVINAGDRTLVFLDHPDGRLEPREVHLGAKLPGGFQVLRGLSAGDRIVTAANFLLDSESSLRAALSSMATPPPPTPARNHALRREP